MRRRLLVGILALVVSWGWIGPRVEAQEPTRERPKRVLLIDQIDELGRTIFDGILSPFQQTKKKESPDDPLPQEARPPRYANRSSLVRVHSGKLREPADVSPEEAAGSTAGVTGIEALRRESAFPESDAADTYQPAMVHSRRPLWGGSSRQAGQPVEPKPAPLMNAYPAEMTIGGRATEASPARVTTDFPETADPASQRLDQRLIRWQESAFADFPRPGADAGVPSAKAEPQLDRDRMPAADRESRSLISEPSSSPEPAFAEAVPDSPPLESPPLESSPRVPTPARRPADNGDAAGPVAESRSSEAIPEVSAVLPGKLSPVAESPNLDQPALEEFHTQAARSDRVHAIDGRSPSSAPDEPARDQQPLARDNVLFTRQSPILDVRTTGPRRLTVGKASTFVVSITNSGPVAADQTVVTIDLPEWSDVAGTESTAGTAGWARSSSAEKQFQWSVGRLDGQSHQELTLKITPTKSQPFDLAVKWDYQPVASQALIEVEEPKVELTLDGPDEILYGSKEVYRLELFNSGSGDAENVEISLTPIGGADNMPATHKVGLLRAGAKKAMEVELTARQIGELTVEVGARADGGVEAKLLKKIVVVRPALQVEIEAPHMRYAGAEAAYRIRVANSGTAAAKRVRVSAAIPAGAEHASSEPTGQLAADGRELTWTLERLAPGAEKSFTLSCILKQPGARLLTVRSTAEGDLVATADATTLVETIPDLVLDVKDPPGPVPVGSDATYRVAIRNRGTETATGVEVVTYFSRGIEPTSAEGGRHAIGPGQVVFEKIPALGVGEDLALVVHAKAQTAGNHTFRVEVYCDASGTRLVSEEMTHFYGESGGPQQTASGDSLPRAEGLRTAERP